MQTAPVTYKDFWFKIIGCVLASYIIDTLDREETIFERLRSKYFYIDIAGGFVIALILWEFVRFITRYLDKRLSWSEQPVKRLLLQLSLGVVLPSFLSFVFTWIWMESAYNQDIFKTSWLNNEFYTVILIILLINLIYFTWWLYLNWKHQSAFALQGNPALGPQAGLRYAASKNLFPFVEAGLVMLADGPPVGFPKGSQMTGYTAISAGINYRFK